MLNSHCRRTLLPIAADDRLGSTSLIDGTVIRTIRDREHVTLRAERLRHLVVLSTQLARSHAVYAAMRRSFQRLRFSSSPELGDPRSAQPATARPERELLVSMEAAVASMRRRDSLCLVATATVARAPSDGKLARVDVVPMHRMRRVWPSGAAVGRPCRQPSPGAATTRQARTPLTSRRNGRMDSASSRGWSWYAACVPGMVVTSTPSRWPS